MAKKKPKPITEVVVRPIAQVQIVENGGRFTVNAIVKTNETQSGEHRRSRVVVKMADAIRTFAEYARAIEDGRFVDEAPPDFQVDDIEEEEDERGLFDD